MMVLPDTGERALRVLQDDMPWLADRGVPRIDRDLLMVGIKPNGVSVAAVYDDANGNIREVPIDPSIVGQPTRVLFGCDRALTAPWN
jgi:hypothetical protein